MQRSAVVGLKAVIGVILAVSVAGQVFVIPFLAAETVRSFPEAESLRLPGIVGCVALVVCTQVALVCLWRLLTMVADDAIFSTVAFGWVNALIVCCAAFTALIAVAFGVLSAANAFPGGLAIMLIAAFIAGAGVTLLLVVMRGLLRKACMLERDLSEVI